MKKHTSDNYKILLNTVGENSIIHEITEEEKTKLKTLLLQMMVDINKVCENNGITLFLGGGTLLGAIRHGGFIPWDDDVDVLMTRDDYNKFVAVFDSALGEKYILNAPNRSNDPITRFPKILFKGTKLETPDFFDDPRACVFLDIFILENVPKNEVIKKIKGTICQLFIGASSFVGVYKRDNKKMRELVADNEAFRKYMLRVHLGKMLSVLPENHWLNAVDRLCQYSSETGLLGIPTGRKHYFGEILPCEVYFPSQRATFENNEFFIPGDYDAYLKNLYRDYMEIPPVEKRETHRIINIDFGKCFDEN